MRFIRLLPILLLAGFSTHIAAANSLYSFSSVDHTYTDRPLSLGFVFTANTAFTVNSLGYFDATGNGFQSSHQVGLFDSNGNLLTSATLSAGAGDPLTNSFRYTSITP